MLRNIDMFHVTSIQVDSPNRDDYDVTHITLTNREGITFRITAFGEDAPISLMIDHPNALTAFNKGK